MSAASPLRQHLDRQATEDDMRAALVEAARVGKWLHWHARDSRQQDLEYWPDDWFLRGGELLFWELKKQGKNPTKGQEAVLEALNAFIDAHGLQDFCQARVIRPADMSDCLRLLMRRPGLQDVEVN